MTFGLRSLRVAAAVPVTIVSMVLSTGLRAASSYDDDFSTGTPTPNWSAVADDPAALRLVESNGRLNLVSAGGGVPTNDALYLSNFRLSTAADFALRIDYALGGYSGAGANNDKLGLTFGVGRDLPDGTDSAAIGVGYGNVLGLVADASTVAYRVNDVQTSGPTEAFSPLTGTLEIDYAASADTLTLRRLNSTYSVTLPPGLVRGTWGATDGLYVAFGGRGSGLSATAGLLSLDNFTLVSGTALPEPACLTWLAVTYLAAGRRRLNCR